MLRIVIVFLYFFTAQSVLAEITGPMYLSVDPMPLVFETLRGDIAFDVEIADTDAKRERGLMKRMDFPQNRAMLFVFDRPQMIMMWMKDTPLPLDMLFVTRDGMIAAIRENTVPFSETLITSNIPVSAIVELRAGTVQRTGLVIGGKVHHPRLCSECKA